MNYHASSATHFIVIFSLPNTSFTISEQTNVHSMYKACQRHSKRLVIVSAVSKFKINGIRFDCAGVTFTTNACSTSLCVCCSELVRDMNFQTLNT